MKYSKNYAFYPDNKALEKALKHFVGNLVDPDPADIMADTLVTVADNFNNTRGNFEQHLYRGTLLDPAREFFEQALTEEMQQKTPLDWAQMQNHLGNILAAQGQQLRDEELYQKAIDAFNSALETYNQEETPSDWAATQYNLGTAMQALGRLQDNAKILNASVDAYTNALLVWSRKETPEEWAAAMHELGATLHAYGLLLKGNRSFQKSVVAYKNALAEFDADLHAFELAATHNNCGSVRHNLGESEENANRLNEAIKSYETAITVCMEQQLPIHLSVLCKVNRSTARSVLAELTNDATLADEVADEIEVIIECFPHALQPLCLKHCQQQMGRMREMAESAAT